MKSDHEIFLELPKLSIVFYDNNKKLQVKIVKQNHLQNLLYEDFDSNDLHLFSFVFDICDCYSSFVKFIPEAIDKKKKIFLSDAKNVILNQLNKTFCHFASFELSKIDSLEEITELQNFCHNSIKDHLSFATYNQNNILLTSTFNYSDIIYRFKSQIAKLYKICQNNLMIGKLEEEKEFRINQLSQNHHNIAGQLKQEYQNKTSFIKEKKTQQELLKNQCIAIASSDKDCQKKGSKSSSNYFVANVFITSEIVIKFNHQVIERELAKLKEIKEKEDANLAKYYQNLSEIENFHQEQMANILKQRNFAIASYQQHFGAIDKEEDSFCQEIYRQSCNIQPKIKTISFSPSFVVAGYKVKAPEEFIINLLPDGNISLGFGNKFHSHCFVVNFTDKKALNNSTDYRLSTTKLPNNKEVKLPKIANKGNANKIR